MSSFLSWGFRDSRGCARGLLGVSECEGRCDEQREGGQRGTDCDSAPAEEGYTLPRCRGGRARVETEFCSDRAYRALEESLVVAAAVEVA